MRRLLAVIATIALVVPLTIAATDGASDEVTFSEFTVPADVMDGMRSRFVDQVLAEHAPGTWAELRYEVSDDDLAALNLPPADQLREMRFEQPTMVDRHGNTQVVDLPVASENGKQDECRGNKCDDGGGGNGGTEADQAVASFAGAGWFGIRPGALLLLITDNSIGWCSAAHVYGSPGAYDISTAGHCGKVGDRATVIAAIGNNTEFVAPVLLDFGTFKTVHDNGIGDDWALIDIHDQYQDLVTPTAVFWGGPRGMYTAEGAVADVSFPGNSLIPDVSVTPDPTLAQGIHHYGHGAGVGGPGGTPRVGTAFWWGPDHFMFEGAITPGDSGSYSNVTTGDTVGDNMEAAGINTHIYVDVLLRQGVGYLAGTRATQVSGTLADGQYVSYPVPADGLP